MVIISYSGWEMLVNHRSASFIQLAGISFNVGLLLQMEEELMEKKTKEKEWHDERLLGRY